MAPAVPHRLFDRLVVLVAILLLAAPLTALEVLRPSVSTLRHDVQLVANRLPHSSTSAPATVPAKPASSTKPAATPKPTPVAPPPTAITNSFVHLRAAASVSSPIITDLNGGTTVQLGSNANATWQEVVYQGKDGYIYRAYLQYQPTPANQ